MGLFEGNVGWHFRHLEAPLNVLALRPYLFYNTPTPEEASVGFLGNSRRKIMIKRFACVSIAVLAFTMLAESKPAVSATALLKDGSTVKGEFKTDKVKGTTLFAKDLVLDTSIVRAVNFTGTNGEAKVELSNGDRFGMAIANPSFTIKSLLGELNVPCGSFRSFSLSRIPVTGKGGPLDGLIFYCTFDDAASVTSPAIGPIGKFMTGNFADGKIGRALMTMPYTKHAAFEFPAGFIKDAGCIEFWAKILKQAPIIANGGDPRLFTITCADNHEMACNIDIVSNDGTGNSGFALRTWFGCKSSISGMRYLRYAELFPTENWRDWHHYAVVWDKEGISDLPQAPRAALLVDGKLIASAGFEPLSAHMIRMPSETPHVLGFTNDPVIDTEHNTKSPFLIDEFKIWNYAKKDFFQDAP